MGSCERGTCQAAHRTLPQIRFALCVYVCVSSSLRHCVRSTPPSSFPHPFSLPPHHLPYFTPPHTHTPLSLIASHTALIPTSGLPPGTAVRYRYGSKTAGWSALRSFRVAPRPGCRGDPPLRFLAFNDVAMSNSLLFDNRCPPWCPGE